MVCGQGDTRAEEDKNHDENALALMIREGPAVSEAERKENTV